MRPFAASWRSAEVVGALSRLHSNTAQCAPSSMKCSMKTKLRRTLTYFHPDGAPWMRLRAPYAAHFRWQSAHAGGRDDARRRWTSATVWVWSGPSDLSFG
jgi:hypothetical protein